MMSQAMRSKFTTACLKKDVQKKEEPSSFQLYQKCGYILPYSEDVRVFRKEVLSMRRTSLYFKLKIAHLKRILGRVELISTLSNPL